MTSFEVSKESLGAAATALSLLPRDINQVAPLGSDPVVKALPGSAAGAALGGAEAANTVAKGVFTARFNEFAALLQLSADKYTGSDQDAADRLAAVADFNGGDPTVCTLLPTPGK